MKFFLANLYLAAFLYLDVNCQCWKQSYTRGIGTPLTKCPLNKEKDGALCYNKCERNYYGVGALCVQTCPSDYNDYGLLCYRSHISQHKTCTNRSIQSCKPCENGFTNDGFFCVKESDFFFKKSYLRDAGQPMNCAEGEEKSSGLCYQKCKQSYIGNGPVCWIDCKDNQYAYDCGVLCVNNPRQCAQFGTGASAAGLGLLGPLLVVPEDIQGSVYASIMTGLIAGAGGALGFASVLIYVSCEISNQTRIY